MSVLFVSGFTLGSGGRGAQSEPQRATPNGGSPAIVSLRGASAIPALRHTKQRSAASATAKAGTGVTSPAGAATASSGGNPPPPTGSAASAAPRAGASAGATKPPPPPPARPAVSSIE